MAGVGTAHCARPARAVDGPRVSTPYVEPEVFLDALAQRLGPFPVEHGIGGVVPALTDEAAVRVAGLVVRQVETLG